MHGIDWSQAGSYEWLVDVWIPALVGAASVLVAVVALVASGRARKIARAAEAARDAEGERSRKEALRARMLEHARDEARLAMKWVNLSFEFQHADVPDDLQPSIAGVAARTALQQSLVPGAGLLYAITETDVEHAFDRSPTEDAGKIVIFFSPVRDELVQRRQIRAVDRIRRWAADPDGMLERMASDLTFADHDLWAYLGTAGKPETYPTVRV